MTKRQVVPELDVEPGKPFVDKAVVKRFSKIGSIATKLRWTYPQDKRLAGIHMALANWQQRYARLGSSEVDWFCVFVLVKQLEFAKKFGRSPLDNEVVLPKSRETSSALISKALDDD